MSVPRGLVDDPNDVGVSDWVVFDGDVFDGDRCYPAGEWVPGPVARRLGLIER